MITIEEYFIKNKALTRSKIRDFVKSKKYFYDKHIAGVVGKKDPSDALIIGSAVDCILTESKEKFDNLYHVVARRSKKADDYEHQLNETLYNEIIKISESVQKQDAYKELKDYKAQDLIQVDMDLGEHFDTLCGLPDWYKISDDGKKCHIVDLKTSKDGDSKKYLYHCLDYWYFEQQALYQLILAKIHPEIEVFSSDHLVVEKDNDDIYNCYVYNLSQDRIEKYKTKILAYIEEIKNEKDFAPNNVSFNNAVTIGELQIYE